MDNKIQTLPVKKLKVNKTACTGCGTCIGLNPELFQFDAENKSEVKEGANFDGKNLEEIKAICPSGAIVEE